MVGGFFVAVVPSVKQELVGEEDPGRSGPDLGTRLVVGLL